ncbi:MAG: alpha/beta fold hydrolase [Betaproteobacteria bacterium]
MDWREFQALQRVAEIGERFVSYVERGNGEPIVLLHGIPTWGYLWHGLLPVLERAGRVLIPDLPGFGYSDKSDRFDRSIAKQAEMIAAWMDTLKVSRAAVVAHDIGGGVALRLATLAPERVTRLCVMNTVCYDSWPIELMLQFGHPEANRKLSAGTATMMLKQALKMGFASSPDDAVLEGLLAPYATEVGKLSLVRNAAALNTNLTTEITALLPRIAAPSLILWGRDDKFQVLKYAQRLARDIPTARLVEIPEARHFLMFDQCDRVAMHLAAFLGSAGT